MMLRWNGICDYKKNGKRQVVSDAIMDKVKDGKIFV